MFRALGFSRAGVVPHTINDRDQIESQGTKILLTFPGRRGERVDQGKKIMSIGLIDSLVSELEREQA